MRGLGIVTLLVWITSVFGQTGRIEGVVALAETENPLAAINVFLEKTTIGTITNSAGYYTLESVPAGEYKMVVSAIGFSREVKTVKVEAGQTVSMDVALVEEATDLPAVVVESISLTGGLNRAGELPGSGVYLSPKQLQQFQYTDINRTLRQVPGVYVQEEDGFGLRVNVGLRGTGSERSSKVTIMEDGILMAPAPYAAPAAYYFPTIGRMHAVEVLKGSSQIRFGPYTTGGAINLLSTPIPSDFSGQVSVLGGSYANRVTNAWVGNQHKNVGYMGQAFLYGSNGFKELDNGGETGFHREDYLAKVRFNTNPTAAIYQSLSVKVGFANEVSNETYLGLTRADFAESPFRRYSASQEDVMKTNQRQLSARYTIRFSDNLEANITAYRNDFSRNWYKLDKVELSKGDGTIGISSILNDADAHVDAYEVLTGKSSANPEALWVKANNRAYYAQGLQAMLRYTLTTGDVKHRLLGSVRIHSDQMDRFQKYDKYGMSEGNMQLNDAGVPGTESNRIESANATAAYLDYELEWNRLRIHPGVRFESIQYKREDYGSNDPERNGDDLTTRENEIQAIVPGIGFDYSINQYWMAFGGVHKGFAPPGVNKDTESESSLNYELGTRLNDQWIAGSVTGFLNDYKNLLGADLAAVGGQGTTALYNGGSALTYGLEVGVTVDPLYRKKSAWRLPLNLGYTFTRAFFTNSFESEFEPWGTVTEGDELPYVPAHQVYAGITVEQKRFSIGCTGQFTSAMRVSAGQGEIDPLLSTDAHFTVDASVEYRLASQVALFARASNLTNQIYVAAARPAGVRPGAPRMVMGGLTATF